MGAAAAIPATPAKNGKVLNLPPEMHALFNNLERECARNRYTREETERIMSSRHKEYFNGNTGENFLENFFIISPKNISFKNQYPNMSHENSLVDKLQSLICEFQFSTLSQPGELSLSKKETNEEFGQIYSSLSKMLQAQLDAFTYHGSIASFPKAWQKSVEGMQIKSFRSLFSFISKKFCFLTSGIKILYNGYKTFQKDSSDVKVHICIYFHADCGAVEVVPHIISVTEHDTPSQTAALTPANHTSNNSNNNSHKNTATNGSNHTPNKTKKNAHNFHLLLPAEEDGSVSTSQNTLQDDLANGPDTDSEHFFIPLPRIYLEYNTLLSTVMDNSANNSGSGVRHSGNHHQNSRNNGNKVDIFASNNENIEEYYAHLNQHTILSDLFVYNVITDFILSKLKMVLSASTASTTKPRTYSEDVSVHTTDLFPSAQNTTAAGNKTAAEESPYSEEEREVRAHVKEYTLFFNDSDSLITPVYKASQNLTPVPAYAADQLYIYHSRDVSVRNHAPAGQKRTLQ